MLLNDRKRIVIKVGSSLLVEDDSGLLNEKWLDSLLSDIATLYQQGHEILIVSSGAVALGRKELNFSLNQLSLEKAQAAASCGQVKLAHAYQEGLKRHQIPLAQILVTLSDSENRKRYLNARNTLKTLLRAGAIPLINENDTVATAEIRYGDNDRLSGRVALMADADLLILLSDIDGLYTAPPSQNPDAKFIDKVTDIDDSIMAMAGDSLSSYGSGGMKTKIAAAKMVVDAGCDMLIAKGSLQNPIQRLKCETKCTHFISKSTKQSAKKNWLMHHLKVAGELVVDEGAKQALIENKSLLAVGVTAVNGLFQKGDTVSVLDASGNEVARGLVNYPHNIAHKIMGKRYEDIISILKYKGVAELVHRDNLVLLSSG